MDQVATAGHDIVARLQRQSDRLSRSERKIATVLIEEMPFSVKASIVELAERANVSPPTVTRFCQRLGCKNYSEFKVLLARTPFVGARFYEKESRARDPGDIADNIIAKAQSALFALNEALDYDLLDHVAEKLSESRIVYAFGSGGTSSMIANEIQNRLFRLGIAVVPSIDHAMQMMMAAAAQPSDVIFASSVSGRNLELARALTIAQDYGIPTIALTKPDTPVSRAAGKTLAIDVPEGSDVRRPSSARYAFLTVVDIIAQLAAIRCHDRANETLLRIKQQLVIHRDEDDHQPMGD